MLKTSVVGYDVGKHIGEDDVYLVFVSSSNAVKRKIMQNLAKFSYEKELNFAVFAVDSDDIKKGIFTTLIEFVEDQ